MSGEIKARVFNVAKIIPLLREGINTTLGIVYQVDTARREIILKPYGEQGQWLKYPFGDLEELHEAGEFGVVPAIFDLPRLPLPIIASDWENTLQRTIVAPRRTYLHGVETNAIPKTLSAEMEELIQRRLELFQKRMIETVLNPLIDKLVQAGVLERGGTVSYQKLHDELTVNVGPPSPTKSAVAEYLGLDLPEPDHRLERKD